MYARWNSGGITYTFQTDIVIPVGVEALITFLAGEGEVKVEAFSGPPGVTASGGVYTMSDNPEPNPFTWGRKAYIVIYTRSGRVKKGGQQIAVEE